MLIRLTTSLLWYGKAYHAGDEIDLPDRDARAYLASRQAEPIDEPPVETAALRTKPPRGKRNGRLSSTR